ncbi:hypothetical protein [Mycobacterium uberis]|nr:hypothetical protein [Mycobacterium uberis]
MASHSTNKFALCAFASPLRTDEVELQVTIIYLSHIDTTIQSI